MHILQLCLTGLLCFSNCTTDETVMAPTNTIMLQEADMETPNPATDAKVISVKATGTEGAYHFSVGIESPDTGCEQYANWWEVVTEDGNLIYRRILGHSHVNEQPFVRSGGAVGIKANQVVIVRTHMNTTGYGTRVFKGTVASGFVATTVAEEFAKAVAKQNPVPTGCAF